MYTLYTNTLVEAWSLRGKGDLNVRCDEEQFIFWKNNTSWGLAVLLTRSFLPFSPEDA